MDCTVYTWHVSQRPCIKGFQLALLGDDMTFKTWHLGRKLGHWEHTLKGPQIPHGSFFSPNQDVDLPPLTLPSWCAVSPLAPGRSGGAVGPSHTKSQPQCFENSNHSNHPSDPLYCNHLIWNLPAHICLSELSETTFAMASGFCPQNWSTRIHRVVITILLLQSLWNYL